MALVASVIASVAQSAADRRLAILAFTFMPDHLHLLVQGTDEGSMLRPFVKLARQRSAVEARRGGFGRLWQDGYFEHTLRADADVVAVAKYIAANPVRAGLVGQAHEWPHSGGSFVEAVFQRERCP